VEARSRGRPRSTAVSAAILAAARDLLGTVGYEHLTIEAIAQRAGVGKQTVYRRWPSKAAVVADAALAVNLVGDPILPADTGDLASDLRGWLRHRQRWLEAPGIMALVHGLVAAAADRSADAARLYDHLTEPQRQVLVRRLEAARQQGHVRADADTTAVADALLGVLLYRTLARGSEASSDDNGVVEALLYGIVARPPSPATPGSTADRSASPVAQASEA
jgi:AcrR family transcriptional regulator